MIAIVKQEGARKFIILSKGQVYLFATIWCSKEYEFECGNKKIKITHDSIHEIVDENGEKVEKEFFLNNHIYDEHLLWL